MYTHVSCAQPVAGLSSMRLHDIIRDTLARPAWSLFTTLCEKWKARSFDRTHPGPSQQAVFSSHVVILLLAVIKVTSQTAVTK